MALGIGLKDNDAALSLAKNLNDTSQDIVNLVGFIKKAAADCEALTHTLGQNTVVRDYLVEVAGALEGTIPGIESVATQLKCAAESGQQVEQLTQGRALVR